MDEGDNDGLFVGPDVGFLDGDFEGGVEGDFDGFTLGTFVGDFDGEFEEGFAVGLVEGSLVGLGEGTSVGAFDGEFEEGLDVGYDYNVILTYSYKDCCCDFWFLSTKIKHNDSKLNCI